MDRFVFKQCLTMYLPDKVIAVIDAYYPVDVLVMISEDIMHIYKDETWTEYKLWHYDSKPYPYNGIVGEGCIYSERSGFIQCVNLTTEHLNCIPCDRSWSSLVFTDTIWIIAGKSNREITRSIFRWNNGWEHMGNLKLARDTCTCVVYNNELYIIGGFNSDHWLDYWLNSVEVFNIETKQIRTVASMKHSRSRPEAIVYHHKIYVVGGYSVRLFKDEIWVAEAEMYDPSSNKWVMSDISFPKTQCRIIVVGGVLYCYDTDELKMYHPVYEWVPIPLPSPHLANAFLYCINEHYLR